MKKIFFLNILLIISANSYGNDLVDLYSDHLPEEIMTNPTFKNMVSMELNKKGQIDPDLIYYYIRYLKEKYSVVRSDSVLRNINKDMTEVQKKSLVERNQWAKDEIDSLLKMNISNKIKNDAIDYIDRIVENVVVDTSSVPLLFKLDTNEMNYFAILFITKDKNITYDSNMNYQQMRLNIENEKRKYFQSEYEAKQAESSIANKQFITDILSHWFLFKDEPRDEHVQVHKFICNVLTRYYAFPVKAHFSFGITYVPYNKSVNITHKVKVSKRNNIKIIDQDINTRQIALSINYKKFTKNYLVPFSYLDFQIAIGINFFTRNIKFNAEFDREYTVSVYNYHEKLDFSKNQIEINSMNNYYAIISSPLFVFHRKLIAEGSFLFGINTISYNTLYQFTYVKTEGYWAGGLINPYYYKHTVESKNSKEIHEKILDNRFIFFPYLSLKYFVNSNISSSISFYFKYVSIVLSYDL